MNGKLEKFKANIFNKFRFFEEINDNNTTPIKGDIKILTNKF